MKIEIKSQFSGSVLFTHEVEENNIKLTLEAAVSAKAYLGGADLRGANLDCVDLRGANLRGANLDGAYLDGANLRGAYLDGANLRGAYLDGEKLSKAPLSLLNLRWAVLITGLFMRIGCQRHTHESWKNFSDDEIAQMDSDAAAFWLEWKEPLLALCDTYHEEPTLEVETPVTVPN